MLFTDSFHFLLIQQIYYLQWYYLKSTFRDIFRVTSVTYSTWKLIIFLWTPEQRWAETFSEVKTSKIKNFIFLQPWNCWKLSETWMFYLWGRGKQWGHSVPCIPAGFPSQCFCPLGSRSLWWLCCSEEKHQPLQAPPGELQRKKRRDYILWPSVVKKWLENKYFNKPQSIVL